MNPKYFLISDKDKELLLEINSRLPEKIKIMTEKMLTIEYHKDKFKPFYDELGYFQSPIIGLVRDKITNETIFTGVVAHELAHFYQFTKYPFLYKLLRGTWICEEWADRIAIKWGFKKEISNVRHYLNQNTS